MKKLLFSAMAAVVLMSACKKDDDEAAGSFTFNGTSVNTAYGMYDNLGEGTYEITLSSMDPNGGLGNLAKTFSQVSFEVDTFAAGTYTYYETNDTAEYDKTKNFRYADVYYNYNLSNLEAGKYSSSPSAGTVTLTGTAPNFGVSYSINFGTDMKVVGKFNGKLQNITE